MFWESELYEASHKKMIGLLTAWDNELTELEQLIEQRKSKGENVQFMLIQLEKSNRRYEAFFDHLQAGAKLFQAMDAELEKYRKYKAEAYEYKQQLDKLTGYRTRITDMQ